MDKSGEFLRYIPSEIYHKYLLERHLSQKAPFYRTSYDFLKKYFAMQKKHRIFASLKIEQKTNINLNLSGGLRNS